MMPEKDADGFLMRWSRRKREAASGADVAEPGSAPQTDGLSEDTAGLEEERVFAETASTTTDGNPDAGNSTATAEAAADDAEIPEDLKDIDIDTLGYEADFTRYLKGDVPDALRRRALRQLWRSDPILANVDGLNDYDGDFTDAALAVKVLETSYKVGRGFLTDEDEPKVSEEIADTSTTGEDVANGDDVAADADDGNATDSGPETSDTAGAEAEDVQEDIDSPSGATQSGDPDAPDSASAFGAAPIKPG
ncbi:MAG TPA: DUF3306 domain-containing protein [Hyphomicrobiaceae bacterium]|nr:DUF3306 domain-containing protein [Hyphomicrobiaceae bacterium]